MIVDAAIRLVRKIESVSLQRSIPWLADRDPNGFFPSTVFS